MYKISVAIENCHGLTIPSTKNVQIKSDNTLTSIELGASRISSKFSHAFPYL